MSSPRALHVFKGTAEQNLVHIARSLGIVIDHDEAMISAFDTLLTYAPSSLFVLLRGAPGTGKEPFARARHALAFGQQTERPMVSLNCAGLSDGVLESELFGHEKGSFTTAISHHVGAFEQVAHGGTLFLDEIGDTTQAFQSKLLRALENKTIRRVGGKSDVDISGGRFVGATNQPLERLVYSGEYRDALLGRLKQSQIVLPPLELRTEAHKRVLARYLIDHLKDKPNGQEVSIDAGALDKVVSMEFPANVRSMRDLLARAYLWSERDSQGLILERHIQRASQDEGLLLYQPPTGRWESVSDLVDVHEAQVNRRTGSPIPRSELEFRIHIPSEPFSFSDVIEQVEEVLADELLRHDGDDSKAARHAQIGRATIRNYKMRRSKRLGDARVSDEQ